MFKRLNPSILLGNLNWRAKALLVLLLSLFVFMGAFTVTHLWIGIPDAERSDIEAMRRQIELIRSRLARRTTRLQTQSAELARNEVIRRTLTGSNADQVGSMITEILREQQLDVVMLVNADGQAVLTRTSERRGQSGLAPRTEQALLAQGLAGNLTGPATRGGVLAQQRGLLVHGRTVVFQGSKPIGVVLVGELTLPIFLQTTTAGTEVSVVTHPPRSTLSEVPGTRTFGSGVTIGRPNREEMIGRLSLEDVAGNPAGTVEFRLPCQFRAALLHNAGQQLLIMGIASLALAGLLWILVEFAFVRRVEKLMRLVGRMDQPDAIQALASFPGTDEIGRLAHKTAQVAVHLSEARDLAVSADRAKSAFLRIIGHELRTPMNGVIGFSTLLRDTTLTHEQLDYVKAVEESGHLMLKLIDDLIDYTAMEASGVVLNPRPVRVREWINGILLLLRPQALRKNLTLESEIGTDIPELIWADTARLQQVLVHLLGNAVKFTATGSVNLKIELLKPDESSTGLLRFRVIDSGMGIAPEIRPLLFKPLSPGDSSIARRHGGMGMGLAICERLVLAMGGTISFRTEMGKGTEFFFSLPIHRETATATPVAASRLETFRRN